MYPVLFPFLEPSSWLGYLKQLGSPAHDDLALAQSLMERRFIPILHGSDIGHYLGISPRLVGHMAKAPHKYYRPFNIPKKKGGTRRIDAPRIFLKTVQRYLLDCILHQVPLHEAVVGFRPKLNCSTGALRHVGRPYLWNIDLKDFFPTVKLKQVQAVFAQIGYASETAFLLARLCCLDGRLPQGAPTSPALANIVFTPADRKLDALAQAAGLVYSRYADDLSFSGVLLIPEAFRREVFSVITAHGFKVNQTKSRLMGPRARREVTGLTVNKSVSVQRKRRRELRAFFHQIRLNPGNFSNQKQKALGYAAWIFGHHEAEGRAYLEIAHSIPDPEPNSRR